MSEEKPPDPSDTKFICHKCKGPLVPKVGSAGPIPDKELERGNLYVGPTYFCETCSIHYRISEKTGSLYQIK